MKTLFVSLSLAGALAGCVTNSPEVVQPYNAQRASTVYDATVLSVRPVTIDGSQSGAGGVAGGVVGAIAGSGVGGGRGNGIGAVVGAVAGAVAGNAIERSATKQNAVELLVQLRNGERRSVVQAVGSETFNSGDPVILVSTGSRTRVMRAPSPTPNG
jgi:outer membrane lipoprotein SlyB